MTWLFTCRHTCEATLRTELARLGLPIARSHSPLAGLVLADLDEPATAEALARWDPAFALQVLPAAQLELT